MGWFDRNNPKPAEPEPVEEIEEEEEEQPEYRVICSQDPLYLEKQINEIAAQGYEVYEFAQTQGASSDSQVNYTVIMKEE